MRARRIALDTHQEPVIITRRDCPVCRSEGFSAHARVQLEARGRQVIATLYQIDSDLLATDEAALSDSAWKLLGVDEGDLIHLRHPLPLQSIGKLRGRIFGRRFTRDSMHAIMRDVAAGRYADVHLAMLLTIMATQPLDDEELVHLTEAMIDVGERLRWTRSPIADKHCVGGLPGHRTTPLVVAMVAANGLWMPKTSSRAITSPAGTADTMETLTRVDLDLNDMRRVVEQESGCLVWGGAVRLSPVDDVLIRISRLMDLDAEAQLVASVLSKKIAAGSSHLVLDLPVGATAKVRSRADGQQLAGRLTSVAAAFGVTTRILLTDGSQPVGNGIGPALEARDILAVLDNSAHAPTDLRERSIELAGALLELCGAADPGNGTILASRSLDSGQAQAKFIAICEAQGRFSQPSMARQRVVVEATRCGHVQCFDNRRLARIAKLAGAPAAPAAGLDLHVHLGEPIEIGQPLYTIHAETVGELNYAREFAGSNGDIVRIGTGGEGTPCD
ncbi:MAG: thymidine phosphorylase family protein [Wenzhouxiangella sp.]|nr:MAG: thymidine phosphorylase family protein [Wenzhouxiangella sp.]